MKSIAQIKSLVDAGQYINIHTPRRLSDLAKALEANYVLIYLNLQGIPIASLQKEKAFTRSLCRLILQGAVLPEEIASQLQGYTEQPSSLGKMSYTLWKWCKLSPKPIVLIMEGIDAAIEHQPFLDFLAMLRAGHIRRDAENAPAFHSVILAGETNLHNLETVSRRKGLRCIPWNIAVDVNLKN